MKYWVAFKGIVIREMWRFWHQKARLVSALVRPLLWLALSCCSTACKVPCPWCTTGKWEV